MDLFPPIAFEAIPAEWEVVRNNYGTFVLCPKCHQPCIQTSSDYLACETWDHTGLVRHKGSVTESWALLNLWQLCETLPQARLHETIKGRWILDQREGCLYRWAPGTLRCINGIWMPPSEPPLPPDGAVLAVCKFRGQVGPRYFVPDPATKGLFDAETRRAARKARPATQRVRKPRSRNRSEAREAGSRW